LIFISYFLLSVIPYTFTNLKNARYVNFKADNFTYEEAVFGYHDEYQIILSTLNLDKTKEKEIIKSVFDLAK
jgi:hypothetical protein